MVVVRCLLCVVIWLLVICCALVLDRFSLCVVRSVPLAFLLGSLLFGGLVFVALVVGRCVLSVGCS